MITRRALLASLAALPAVAAPAAARTVATGGRVATIVMSPLGKTNFQSSVQETLYSLLRTIEDSWNLPRLGDAGCSCTVAMREYFR